MVLEGQTIELVSTASGWAARREAPGIAVRQQADGSWTLFDGQGRTYVFTTVSPSLNGANLWLLKTITGAGGSRVALEYSITTPTVQGATALAIDLTSVSYNSSPTIAGCFKNSVVLHYTPATTPTSIAMLGDRVLTHMDRVDLIDVNGRASCSDPTIRLRRYELQYQESADTHLPQLHVVRLFGREDTPQAAFPMPLATYSYGSATNAGRLQYQASMTATNAASKRPFTTNFTTLAVPGGGVVFATGRNLLDITGDGLPDVISYTTAPLSLTWLPDWLHSNGTRTFDSSFPVQPFDLSGLQQTRYQATSNVDRVWRQSIDVNGDGRVDVVDAAEQAGHWVVYLNTPDPSDARLPKWLKRSYSIQQLATQLNTRGFAVDPSHVPLSQRSTSRQIINRTCWMWNGAEWIPSDKGFLHGKCTGPKVDSGPEGTFTDWEVRDVNGDGYPDVVFNSSPVILDTQTDPDPDHPPPDPDAQAWITTSSTATPTLPETNAISGMLNVLGVHFDLDAQPFSSPVTLASNDQCGVARWAGVDGTHQELRCAIADINGDGLADRVFVKSVYLGTGLQGAGGFFTSTAFLTLPGALALQRNSHASSCAPPASGSTQYVTRQTAGLHDVTGDGIPDYIANDN
ncbi:MAG: hypothetical protein ACREBE_12190, partial [bacterium]